MDKAQTTVDARKATLSRSKASRWQPTLVGPCGHMGGDTNLDIWVLGHEGV